MPERASAVELIAANQLREWVRYDPETGEFYWLKRPAHRNKIGDRAGFNQANGYRAIRLLNVAYLAHRLAWLYMTGEWPKAQVDHINLKRGDNRWRNLRDATQGQNGANTRLRANNTTGFKCVRPTRFGTFSARFRNKHIGNFPTVEEAQAAYGAAVAGAHGEEFVRLK